MLTTLNLMLAWQLKSRRICHVKLTNNVSLQGVFNVNRLRFLFVNRLQLWERVQFSQGTDHVKFRLFYVITVHRNRSVSSPIRTKKRMTTIRTKGTFGDHV